MKDEEISKCLDSRCDMSLVDCEFLISQSHKSIKRIIVSFKIREIDDREYDTSKYCELDFYKVESHDEVSIIAHFKREMHVMNDFRAKIFIDIDILRLEVIVLDVAQQ